MELPAIRDLSCPNKVMATASDAIAYFREGYHAFVASDSVAELDKIVTSIEEELREHPLQVLDGRQPRSLSAFANEIAQACGKLLDSIEAQKPQRADSLSQWLSHVQKSFQEANRQGYLVVNQIDDVIRAQDTIELEGPFREVMQFNDDVAIVWLGSRDVILEIHQYERPFYLSHRIFWL